MKSPIVIVNEFGRTFKHGDIEIVKRDGIEFYLEAEIHLTVSQDSEFNAGKFAEELSELIKKYAI